MISTLYHYVHCPYCIRVRMAFGLLNFDYKSHVLPYDDEVTPLKLTGVKMLPILELGSKSINESLEIISMMDVDNRLKVKEITTAGDFSQFEKLLSLVGSPVHSLAMPYWIWTPEFTDSSRHYFQEKKEVKRGPFKDLVKQRQKFIAELVPFLEQIERELSPFYQSKDLGLKDILIAAQIWGLYVVPEFQFSEKMHSYLQQIKTTTLFNYHQDFWS